MANDYYTILGVARDATPQEIKRAFRQIARECHPDVAGGDAAAEERFKGSRTAYETLMDPVARARYDRRDHRRAAPAGGSFFDALWRASGRHAGARDVRVTLDDLSAAPGSGRVSVRGARPQRARGPRAATAPPAPEGAPPEHAGSDRVVDISLAQAVLGGRVSVATAQGTVTLTIAAGTSGGTRLRLRARGVDGADLVLVTRVVVPTDLDAASRGLIEEFARLNP